MSRVKKETIAKLHEFFDTLPTEARSKCALCNETLTHIVKTAEVETGAGTATVTRELANRINDGAAPGDQVSGEALRQRAREASGEKTRIRSNGPNKPEAKECHVCGSVYPGDSKHCPNRCDKAATEKPECTEAHQFSTIATSQLSRIRKDDPEKIPELVKVLDWIIEQIHDTGDDKTLADCAKRLEPYLEKEPVTLSLDIPDCHGRKLKVAEIDSILIRVVEQYPGRENAQKRARLLNDAGVPCSTRKKGP